MKVTDPEAYPQAWLTGMLSFGKNFLVGTL